MVDKLDRGVNVAIGLAAVAIAFVALRREFTSVHANSNDDVGRPVYISNWTALLQDGLTIGHPTAPVQIVEFADMECPYCASWHIGALKDAIQKHNRTVAFTMVHFPLPSHRFAKHAAMAVECGAEQGVINGMLNAVYAKQDSIGLKSWRGFADEAGIHDLLRFEKCITGPAHPRIAAGEKWAQKLNIFSTPTIIINGWRLHRPPDAKELSRIVTSVVSGEQPFPTTDSSRAK